MCCVCHDGIERKSAHHHHPTSVRKLLFEANGATARPAGFGHLVVRAGARGRPFRSVGPFIGSFIWSTRPFIGSFIGSFIWSTRPFIGSFIGSFIWSTRPFTRPFIRPFKPTDLSRLHSSSVSKPLTTNGWTACTHHISLVYWYTTNVRPYTPPSQPMAGPRVHITFP